jgi:peptidoglycan/xylan/chitin deacetylase (PgdA/CDA1 family)
MLNGVIINRMIISIVIFLFLLGLFYASFSIRAGIYLKAFCRRQTDEQVVALTFDDGPDCIQTPKVLDVLKEYGAKATFFCIGSSITGNESIVERIIAEGHTIGNHAYTHSWQFPFFSALRMSKDMEQCRLLLEKVSHRKVDWFRPPFGVTNPVIAKTVKKLTYKVIGWNIRSLDTQLSSHSKIIQRICKKMRPGSIILLHDRLPGSELLVRMLIEELESRQYKIIGLESMIESDSKFGNINS